MRVVRVCGTASSMEGGLHSVRGSLGLSTTPGRFRTLFHPRSTPLTSLKAIYEGSNRRSSFGTVATPRADEDLNLDGKEGYERIVSSIDVDPTSDVDREGFSFDDDSETDTTIESAEDIEDEMDEDDSELDEDEEENDEHDGDVVQVEADTTDPSLLLKNYDLSKETLQALEKRGITALFPIQKHVFDPAMEGRDLIGRAKTGSGKTLAFAIPVIENLLKENRQLGRVVNGRPPRALVVTPTRELANQVCREFASVCPTLIVKSFYGGTSLIKNRSDLRLGIDVAVGTPGRLMDLVRNQYLNLSKIRFAILDESDQMLDMGFEEDMEQLLAYTPSEKQTMLFSATLPNWVRKTARKYLKNFLTVDLLGDQGTGRISDTIKALGIFVDRSAKQKMLGDLLATYAAGRQSILFTQTKREADIIHSTVSNVVSSAVLHGDIAQNTREETLRRFRAGGFSCLVATDVASRGLDIPSVDLVLHYDCPQSHESFIHRSGRTGRAGKTGTTLVMVTRDEIHAFHRIIKESKTDIEMIGPPNPRDVMQASTKSVMEKIQKVRPEVVKFFEPAAEKLLENESGKQILAAALASMSGFTKVPQSRSLLSQDEGMVTLRFVARPGRIVGFGGVLQVITDLLGQNPNGRDLGRYEPAQDERNGLTGVMIDVKAELALQLLQNAAAKHPSLNGIQVDRPETFSLTQLIQKLPDRSSKLKRKTGGNRSNRSMTTGSRDNDNRSRTTGSRNNESRSRNNTPRVRFHDDDDWGSNRHQNKTSGYDSRRGESSHGRRSRFFDSDDW